MENNRRGFLKKLLGGAAATAALSVIPNAAVKLLAPKPFPSPLFVSISKLRPGWVARCLRLGTRLRDIRLAVVAAGAAAGAALKAAFRMGGRATWYDPRFSPSLRNITDGSTR